MLTGRNRTVNTGLTPTVLNSTALGTVSGRRNLSFEFFMFILNLVKCGPIESHRVDGLKIYMHCEMIFTISSKIRFVMKIKLARND